MFNQDTLTITILPDGMVKIETDEISMGNHVSAESFVQAVERLVGGKPDIQSKQNFGYQQVSHTHHDHVGH